MQKRPVAQDEDDGKGEKDDGNDNDCDDEATTITMLDATFAAWAADPHGGFFLVEWAATAHGLTSATA